MNVSDMTVTDEDGYLSRSKTFNSKSEHEQEMSNESPMCDKNGLLM